MSTATPTPQPSQPLSTCRAPSALGVEGEMLLLLLLLLPAVQALLVLEPQPGTPCGQTRASFTGDPQVARDAPTTRLKWRKRNS